MVASLKARIEAGEYNPTSHEIVDTMIRRAIADRMR
jgi:anti-sigma28 factor (negative regulator of flagellin synthesis)